MCVFVCVCMCVCVYVYVCVCVVWCMWDVGGLSKTLSAKASRLHSLAATDGIDTVSGAALIGEKEGRNLYTIP